MSSPSEVMNEYLDAFTSGPDGGEKARGLLADDFEFHGPMLQTSGVDEFLEGASGLGPIVRGYRMIKQVEDGNDVISIYDFLIGAPGQDDVAITMSEWATVLDGKLTRSVLLFNVKDFEAAMAPA